MRRTCAVLFLVALGGLLVAGCVRLLEPRPSNTKYYLLDSRLDAAATPPSDEGLRLGLRKPRLADYLDTPTIVTRHPGSEIRFSEFHRWGEDLGTALNRVVGLNLEAQPGIASAEVVPWPQGATFDYVVQLRVLRFEGVGPPPPGPDADDDAPVPTGHSEVTVAWTLFGPEGDAVRTRGRTQHRIDDWPVTDYAALVSHLDSSLVVLAEDIRSRLQSLDAQR
jgi:uncharacterized lipoprotein YmbA